MKQDRVTANDAVFDDFEQASPSRYFLRAVLTDNRVEIPDFPFTIGRSSSSDLILSDRKVSRRHAVVDKTDNNIIIENDNSLNGIRVNHQKIERTLLTDGDEVQIASVKFIFEAQQPAETGHQIVDGNAGRLDAVSAAAASNDDSGGHGHDLNHEEDSYMEEETHGYGKTLLIILLSLITIAIMVSFFIFLNEAPDLGRVNDDAGLSAALNPSRPDL